MAKNSAKAAVPASVDGQNKRKREEKLMEKTNKKEKIVQKKEESESEEEEEEEDNEEEEQQDDEKEDDDEDNEDNEMPAEAAESSKDQDMAAIDFSANDIASPAGKEISHIHSVHVLDHVRWNSSS